MTRGHGSTIGPRLGGKVQDFRDSSKLYLFDGIGGRGKLANIHALVLNFPPMEQHTAKPQQQGPAGPRPASHGAMAGWGGAARCRFAADADADADAASVVQMSDVAGKKGRKEAMITAEGATTSTTTI